MPQWEMYKVVWYEWKNNPHTGTPIPVYLVFISPDLV